MTVNKQCTSLIIDGIFLQNAINKTIEIYSELKPGTRFYKPELLEVINLILDWYDKTNALKKTINCHVWMSDAFNLESRINISQTKHTIKTSDGNLVKVIFEKSSIIGPELLDQLVTLVKKGDVILVADDRMYEPTLDKLFDMGYTITVVMLNESDGSEMITSFNWGDIVFPLGMAMGMEKSEL